MHRCTDDVLYALGSVYGICHAYLAILCTTAASHERDHNNTYTQYDENEANPGT